MVVVGIDKRLVIVLDCLTYSQKENILGKPSF